MYDFLQLIKLLRDTDLSRFFLQKSFNRFFYLSLKNIYLCIVLLLGVKYYMPKIFEYFGFIFYFFSNEHEPIHVHVALGDCETIFELIMENGELKEIRRRTKKGVDLLRENDAKTAEEFIRKYEANIIEKWINFFVLKKQIRCTNIKKKI